jgi:hypothetical protein
VAGGDGALGGLDWRIWYLERDDGVASAPLDTAGVCCSTSITTFILILTTLGKVFHAHCYLLPFFYPLSRLGILGPYLYHFIPSTTYLYLPHTNICVLFSRILIFHLLSFFLNACYIS